MSRWVQCNISRDQKRQVAILRPRMIATTMAIFMGMMACALPSANRSPSGLALQVTVPAGTAGNDAIAPAELSSLQLSSAELRILIANDDGIGLGGAFRDRF
ncbi:MAG: hypothetical protein ABR590_01400, partial [Spirochaetia bacterium]